MKRIFSVIVLGAMLLMTSTSNSEEEKGIIGRVYEDESPVIYKFVNEMPPAEVRKKLGYLTVISWKYDGSSNNGMPLPDVNQRMIELESQIEDHIESDDALRHAYSRTGNNLKELVYYIHDQNEFLEAFNKAMSDKPRFPIEINFYEDKEWKDFEKLLSDFSNG